jgi:hypothetical protein
MSVGDPTTAQQPPLLSGRIQRRPLLSLKSEHQASESISPKHETRTAISRTGCTRTTATRFEVGQQNPNPTDPGHLERGGWSRSPRRAAALSRRPESQIRSAPMKSLIRGGGTWKWVVRAEEEEGKEGVLLTMAAASIQRRPARGGGGGADRRTPRRGDRDRMRQGDRANSLRRGERPEPRGGPALSPLLESMRC